MKIQSRFLKIEAENLSFVGFQHQTFCNTTQEGVTLMWVPSTIPKKLENSDQFEAARDFIGLRNLRIHQSITSLKTIMNNFDSSACGTAAFFSILSLIGFKINI